MNDYADMLSGRLGCGVSMTPYSEYQISIGRDIWKRPAVTLWHLFPFMLHGRASQIKSKVPLKGRNTRDEAITDAWHLLYTWWQHGPVEMLIEAYELGQTQEMKMPVIEANRHEPVQLSLW